MEHIRKLPVVTLQGWGKDAARTGRTRGAENEAGYRKAGLLVFVNHPPDDDRDIVATTVVERVLQQILAHLFR